VDGLKSDQELIREIPEELAVIPINDGVVFPYMLVPLILKDENLIRLIDEALAQSKIVGVFTQIDSDEHSPGPDNIYHTGCAMLIQKMARFPDGHIRIIGQGLARIEIREFTDDQPFMRAAVRILEEPESEGDRVRAVMLNVVNSFLKLVDASEGYPDELKGVVAGVKEPGRLADLVAADLNVGLGDKQRAVEIIDPRKRLEFVYGLLGGELEIARIGEKIREDVHQEMDKEQREYYLRQQIKAIRKELGDEDATVELEELKERIELTAMPDTAREATLREYNRLSRMSTSSSEYIVSRTYLEWILELPWERSTEDRLDIRRATKILNKDHYDLAKVKERIIEYLAVRKLKKDVKGSILCFTGPPGVGKTSLGRSIASAMGRAFVRISLGGIRDEADIRGHRRTYIGALPGRIIQGIKTAGSNNPVFMLDEVDKLGRDFRGDPASALLEVLDPQQNHSFEDHYINLPFDLSRVLFITTGNIKETIPLPLLDRMEVIELPGYITSDKVAIARRYLIPRQMEENGIPSSKLEVTPDALRIAIDRYTREAGVRNLERLIATMARKTARKLVDGGKGPYRITGRNLENYIGREMHAEQQMLGGPEVGVSTGMAKTAAGGEILFIEALGMRGEGRVKLTGHLGDVMKESAHAAVSFVKSRLGNQLSDENFFEKSDIHLHIPAGSIPKDGPSAGVAIANSLASLATGRKIRHDVAMTGEITLTGKVLPVGAVKDKVIAAHRAGIKEVILPSANRKDLEDIPRRITKDIRFDFIDRVEQSFSIALINGKVAGRKGKRGHSNAKR
jgi:ATP-dependent Lon protease